jgi:hypothetical protein
MFLQGWYRALWIMAFFLLPSPGWTGSVPRASPGGGLMIDDGLVEKMVPSSRKMDASSNESFSKLAGAISLEYGVSPRLVKTIIQAESNGDSRAISPKGAMGLMQLMPDTARAYRVLNPFDPGENIRAGVRYLRDLLREFSGDLSLSLAAYNAGSGAVRKYQGIPPYPETQEFVRKVQGGYQMDKSLGSLTFSPMKEKEPRARGKISAKVFLSGSPRDVGLFLRKMEHHR